MSSIPARLVAGEAQRPPREGKSTVRTVATLPEEPLYGLKKLHSSKPALPLSTRHRLLCPVLPVLPSYGPMFHFSQLKTKGGNARKSARRVPCMALAWLDLAGSLPQPKASRYINTRIDVPHQFHPEIRGNICRSFHGGGSSRGIGEKSRSAPRCMVLDGQKAGSKGPSGLRPSTSGPLEASSTWTCSSGPSS